MLFCFSVEAKRTIIRQGHKPFNFYLIISGTGQLPLVCPTLDLEQQQLKYFLFFLSVFLSFFISFFLFRLLSLLQKSKKRLVMTCHLCLYYSVCIIFVNRQNLQMCHTCKSHSNYLIIMFVGHIIVSKYCR